MNPYELDVAPTVPQFRILAQLLDGDRVVVSIGGAGFRWERGSKALPPRLIGNLVNFQWITKPDYPLLGPPGRHDY